MRSISRSADDRLARCSIRSRFISRVNSSQNSSKRSWCSSFSCSALSTRASTSSRRMVRWLSQRPWSRAPKHPSRFLPDMMKPAPQIAAFRQTGEQVLRPLRHADGAGGLHRVPGLSSGADFAAVQSSSGTMRSSGTSFAHPLGFRIEPRHTLSGVGILHVAQAVPDQPADVQLVVQNPGSALARCRRSCSDSRRRRTDRRRLRDSGSSRSASATRRR